MRRRRFPDGELQPAVGHVRGDDAYVVRPGPEFDRYPVELIPS
ncbi:hypothetical protein [Kitasatospora sp. NPDC051914]